MPFRPGRRAAGHEGARQIRRHGFSHLRFRGGWGPPTRSAARSGVALRYSAHFVARLTFIATARLTRYLLWLAVNLTVADAADDWSLSVPPIPPNRQRVGQS